MISIKNTFLATIALLFCLAGPASAIAQGSNSGGQNQFGPQNSIQTTTQGNQIQNQLEVQTKNQGEDSQLQVATQHMEMLMAIEGLSQEKGQELKQIAQAQTQAQNQIQQQLNKLESRQTWVRAILGPDYGAIKNLKKQAEQNQLRIKQLTQLKNQLSNQTEQDQIQLAVQALIEQNTALQEKILTEENVSSLLGWFFKLIS